MSQTIGLVGGTFDPVHAGHVALIKAAMGTGRLDACLVMPAGKPPHKKHQRVMPAAYRLEMACQALSGLDGVEVSDLEIARRGPSYTLRTVKQLQEGRPGDEIVLVYGSDILQDLERWHQPQSILSACPLLLARRGGYQQKQLEGKAAAIRQKYGARIEFFDCPSIELSSTRLRQDLMQGEKPAQDLPEAVLRFIDKHALYRDLEMLAWLPDSLWQEFLELEQALWPYLTRPRLLHSLNVMRYSLHLARLHQVQPRRAGLAALLHDAAKCLPRPLQQKLARQAGDLSLMHDDLAHAPAGMIFARDQFGMADPGILKAIFCHTTGCRDMNRLDKILFLADKIEPARRYERLDPIRSLAEKDLDRAMLLCLEEIGLHLKREKQKPHPYSLAAMKQLHRKVSQSHGQTGDDVV